MLHETGITLPKTLEHIGRLKHEDELERKIARVSLMKMFGSMEAVDKFYRMYLRARGQPEKITKLEHDGTIATTYHDLDEKPKARTPEETKRIAEGLVDVKSEK